MSGSRLLKSLVKFAYVCLGATALALPPMQLARAQGAAAQPATAYPSAAIRIVTPYPPGGGTDILSRAIAQKLNESFGQPVIVDNRVGANGTIGAAYVAKAPPDGLTLLVIPAGYAANPALYKSLPYNQSRDLIPVSMLASGPLVLVTHPSLGVQSVKELIALAKSKPGVINVGSAGVGSLPHLSAELFNLQAGVKMVHIPYKGAGPAVIDVLAGIVPVYFMNILQALPLIRSGKLRALGVTSPERSAIAPELPPIADALPGFDMTNWYGMLAPAGTPKEVVAKLQAEIAKILKQPAVREKLDNEGMTVVADTPAVFGEFLGKETIKYNRIVSGAGIVGSN